MDPKIKLIFILLGAKYDGAVNFLSKIKVGGALYKIKRHERR